MLTLIAFGGLSTALVLVLRSNSINGYSQDQRANVEANHQAQILVAQDQAPHAVALRRAATAQVALERAIAADVSGRIRRNEFGGPIQRTRCMSSGPARTRRQAFHCTVRAADVDVPFLGVIDRRARRITWCKRDPPASPAVDVPVSRRCRP